MIDTNEIQIGGSHYRKAYQHWDLVIDLKIHYLIANATKYVSRWRDKNGVEDLRKSIHYLTKAQDHFIFSDMKQSIPFRWFNSGLDNGKLYYLDLFCSQFDEPESNIIYEIVLCDDDYLPIIRTIEELITKTEFNIDPNYIRG